MKLFTYTRGILLAAVLPLATGTPQLATVYAQVTNEGTPRSWESTEAQEISPIIMPTFDLRAMQEEDVLNDQEKLPFRFGKEFQVSYSPDNAGAWTTLEDGSRIWRIRFLSEGANTLNFIFDEFYLPEGGTVYLYSHDRRNLIGAYDHTQNLEERVLGTWLVSGDDVWIEYHEPAEVRGQGALNIGTVVHGYRSVNQYATQRGLNDSGDCNLDVDCPIDPQLEAYKDHNKRSVCLIVMSGFVCSGSLINNTDNDNTPYVLTANHCDAGSPGTWSFRFNWISPNPVCATTANSTSSSFNSQSGATTRATDSGSDFRLLELLTDPLPTWNLTWSGWNRSSSAPSVVFGIHHPSGDIMKVCVSEENVTAANVGGTQVWHVPNWTTGVTEGGSSGSPLYNQDGLIIGDLCCGGAACNGTAPNSDPDFYGRLNVSWTGGGTSATRLSDWLDPGNTGAMTQIPDPPFPSVSIDGHNLSEISIYPNPSHGLFNIHNPENRPVSYVVYNMLGQEVVSDKQGLGAFQLDLTRQKTRVYFLKIKGPDSGRDRTVKLVVR